MRILLLNQCFHPDVAATAQVLSGLALEIKAAGHEVTVISSRSGYDVAEDHYPAEEIWRGIRILRVAHLNLGKGSAWRRAAGFTSFLWGTFVCLCRLRDFDVVLSLTSPPLLPFLAARFVRWRGGKLVLWIMDLNPEEAISHGWLREEWVFTRLLRRCLDFSYRTASCIAVLDRFMMQRIIDRGVDPAKVLICPPLHGISIMQIDVEGRNRFREDQGVTDEFVVMYSGNHSPCNPLDTVLEAARELASHREIVFYFVGGGSEFSRVESFKERHKLTNIRCLPYQPQAQLSGLLSSADLHVVSLGNQFRGIKHPCKVYNILHLRLPVIYFGPTPSHVTDLYQGTSRQLLWPVEHGDVENAVRAILKCKHFPRERDDCATDARFPIPDPKEIVRKLDSLV